MIVEGTYWKLLDVRPLPFNKLSPAPHSSNLHTPSSSSDEEPRKMLKIKGIYSNLSLKRISGGRMI